MEKDFYQQYVSELLKKADLTDDNGEIDNSYSVSLAEELKKKIGLMIMSELSAEQLDEYGRLAQSNSSDETLGEFFKKNIADFENKRDKTLQDFAFNFLQRTAKMRQALNS